MKVAIMQPYFLPYVGYFQLIGAVDLFVLHDDVKYTKKGWINRNRILQNGRDAVISLPLKAGSDALCIRDREIAEDFRRDKLLNRIREAYSRAPHFGNAWPLVRDVVENGERNLFEYLRRSLELVCDKLGIRTPMRRSSEFAVPSTTKGEDRVIALCKAAGATVYLNPIGGTELYSHDVFRSAGIDLGFLRARAFEYPQFDAPFVPWLSIIDVMMFNPQDAIARCLASNFDIVQANAADGHVQVAQAR